MSMRSLPPGSAPRNGQSEPRIGQLAPASETGEPWRLICARQRLLITYSRSREDLVRGRFDPARRQARARIGHSDPANGRFDPWVKLTDPWVDAPDPWGKPTDPKVELTDPRVSLPAPGVKLTDPWVGVPAPGGKLIDPRVGRTTRRVKLSMRRVIASRSVRDPARSRVSSPAAARWKSQSRFGSQGPERRSITRKHTTPHEQSGHSVKAMLESSSLSSPKLWMTSCCPDWTTPIKSPGSQPISGQSSPTSPTIPHE